MICWLAQSNNTNFDPREDLETINHTVVVEPGWYTFEHLMYENPDNELSVEMNLYDQNGDWKFTEIRDSNAANFGGNRYVWFTNINVAGGIAVDQVSLQTVDTNLVQRFDSTGNLILESHATIQDAVDASMPGEIIRVADNVYNENVIVANNADITLELRGTINGTFDGNDTGTTIRAIGNLTIGDNTSSGFAHDGTLLTGTFKVTLLDSNTASLGVLTNVAGGGELEVDNGVNLGSGKTLTGEGTVDANVNLFTGTVAGNLTIDGALDGSQASGGTVTPGFSPGTLNTGDFTLSSTDTLNMEVDGVTTPGTDYDRINVTGTATLYGTLDFTMSDLTGATIGDSVVLISNDGVDSTLGQFSGYFDTVLVGGALASGSFVTINGESWLITYVGGDGNDVELIRADAAPVISYVDDDWAGTSIGADPDGAGPAIAFGYDAFVTVQAGINALTGGGDVIIYDHAGSGYNEALTITSQSIDLLAAAGDSPVIDGTGLFGTGLVVAGLSSVVSVDGLSFENHFSDGISSVGALTLNNVSIDGGFNGLTVSGGTADVDATTISNASIFGVSVSGGAMLDLDQSEVTGSANTGIIVTDGVATISHSKLTSNGRGLLVSGSGSGSINDSDISGNTTKGVENATGTAINASGNWWGSNVATAVQAATTGLVDFTPFLDSGTDNDGGAVGFTGDFSTLNVTALGSQAGGGPRIQEAIGNAADPSLIKVHDGTYNGQILIDHSLTLDAVNDQGATLSMSSGSNLAIVTVAASDVTISDFDFLVNQTNATAGVYMQTVGDTFTNLTVDNNVFRISGSAVSGGATGFVGFGTDSTAIAIRNTDDSTSAPTVTITDNQVLATTPPTVTAMFDRAIFLRAANGLVDGNTIWGDSHDLAAQFVGYGTLMVSNNFFMGVGGKDTKGAQLDITEPNSHGSVSISGNTFTPYTGTVPSGSSHVRSLMIKNNTSGVPVVIDNNLFTVSQVGILVGNSNATTITNNTFNALAGDSDFVHLQVSNKVATGGAPAPVEMNATIQGNTFGESTVAGGRGIEFLNHNSASATFGTITIGGEAHSPTRLKVISTSLFISILKQTPIHRPAVDRTTTSMASPQWLHSVWT